MDPTDQNTQEQEQPCSPALRKRLLEQEDDTDAYNLGALPQEVYDTAKRIKTHDFLAGFDQPKREIINISSDEEAQHESEDRESESDVSNRIAARTLPLFPTSLQEEYSKNIARRYAARIHNASENKNNDAVNNVADKIDDNNGVKDEVDDDDDSPTPFSEAIKAIQERAERNKKREIVEEPPLWIPKRSGKDLVRRRSYVPSLQELSLNILAKHSDAIASLDCVCDELRHRLSNLLCDSRKMNCHFLELLLTDVPTQIRLKDCSWLTEEEFTKYFGTLVTSEIEVLQLDKCGRFMTEYTLPATLAKSPNSLCKLTTLSLTGACRLTNEGLRLLVSSATEIRSINLSQCSLLTYASLDILADSLGSVLKELYIDDCILIDVALILPALKRFKRLEVLSLAGVPTVSDKFIMSYFTACGHNIKELVLRDCVNLTDASMRVIAKHCPGLRVLDIMNLGKLTDLSIGYLANSCQGLRTLKLHRNPFSDEAISVFLELAGKTLEELSLNSINKVGLLTSSALTKNGQNLHTLDLSWCRNLSDNEFGLIVDSCLSLRSLKIFGCSQLTEMFFKGHSNSGVRIIGLKLSPLFQQFESCCKL
ncbi:SCF E3 ubiquitin ligase complex F-box protein grrA-like [Vicia villosa]|uniref:SCF E3 ubiquitin ligase complex F-box protein grrA-like n=1 Tax=Vicia villosa TaxID=3911 RepID=UPI00273CA119|nr:SCF E3 ubiquitin ligase complex F-box protein grrA-like [Vicia villosa]